MKRTATLFCLHITFIFHAYNATSQVIFQGSTTAIGTSGNAIINKPAATGLGDLLIIGLMFEKGSALNISAPLGWNLIRRTNNGSGGGVGMATYYKVATAAETPNYNFNLNGNPSWAIGISRLTGVDLINPINASGGTTGNGNPVTAPSITTGVANTFVLCFYTNKEKAFYVPAATTTERYDAPNLGGNVPSNMMATFVSLTAGATGSKDATPSQEEIWAAQQIAIKPASGGPLPINLMSFSGTASAKVVSLYWRTDMELNNDYISIERSLDGRNFNEIGRIAGSGNSNSIRDYTYTDEQPGIGPNYYRLRQVNFDGVFRIHQVIQVLFKPTNLFIQVYPNPASDKLKISRRAASNVGTISIIDLTGRNIFMKKMNALELVTEADISSIPKGFYFLLYEEADRKEKKAFLKL